jgi:antitoxin component of MazEF toxin-antitoxin module
MDHSQTLLKWGNGYGVRVPKQLIEYLNIKPGQSVKMSKVGNGVMIKANNDAQARVDAFRRLQEKTRYVRLDHHYTREEMNER